MSNKAPTTARISSISHWITFFHPVTGIFRHPSKEGETIQHLDIDLRFVDYADTKEGHGHGESGAIHLPNVCVVTLRGGEYVQDHEDRMEQLAEVLAAVNPVEAQWLNASNDPSEQLTFATHLVHPAIIVAGEIWGQAGLRKLVLEGGFPCPNLSAPTPYSQTPSQTPLPSPRASHFQFGDISHSAFHSRSNSHSSTRPSSPIALKVPHTPFSGLPALSTTRPKAVDPERLRAREERKRLADYTLKPRFDFAFGSWGAEEWAWRVDGKYTPACITSILTHWLRAMNKTFPSPTNRTDHLSLPSLVSFAPIPINLIPALQELPEVLELKQEFKSWLFDVTVVSTGSNTFARLWEEVDEAEITRSRQARRLKSEVMLLDSHCAFVELSELVESNLDIVEDSPSMSVDPLTPGETEGSTDDEDGEAQTPELGQSVFLRGPEAGKVGVKEESTGSQGVAPLIL